MSNPSHLPKAPAAPYAVGWSDDLDEEAIEPPWADAGAACPEISSKPEAVDARGPIPAGVAPLAAPCPAAPTPAASAVAATPPAAPPQSSQPAGVPPSLARTSERASDAAEPIPLPVVDKLDRFPALASRGGLFRVGIDGGQVFKAVELACLEKERRLVYTGPKLTMDDKRVWEVVLATAKQRGAGVEIRLSARGVAAALKRSTGGKETNRIVASLKRLAQAEIIYELPGGARGSARLLKSLRKAPGCWMATLDPDLLTALREDKQFRIDVARRESLSSRLAKWLHDFLSTHAPASKWDFELGRLAELCGADPHDTHFPANLDDALTELMRSCPSVLASHQLGRIGREWAFWTVSMRKGDEKAEFTWPAEEERKAQAKRDAAAARKQAREGRRQERATAKKQARGVGGVVL